MNMNKVPPWIALLWLIEMAELGLDVERGQVMLRYWRFFNGEKD